MYAGSNKSFKLVIGIHVLHAIASPSHLSHLIHRYRILLN